MVEFWVSKTQVLNTYKSLCIESSDTVHKLHSSVGEFHINNAYLKDECSKKWMDNGFSLSVYDIGKFRSKPCYRGDHSWMYTSDFDCIYDKNKHLIRFIKTNPLSLQELILNSITSVKKLINIITKMKCNNYYSLAHINMVNKIIEKNKLLIIDNSQLITLDELNILTEISTINIEYNYPVDDYPYFINNIIPRLTNLKDLVFSDSFNLPIDILSNLINLEKISFGYYFNQSIEPLCKLTNLTELIFDCRFDQPLDSLVNLENLEKIYLDEDFSKPIDSLKCLKKLVILYR
jgi:hypothetical protein